MHVKDEHRLLASALCGDRNALKRVADEIAPDAVRHHRIGPSLAIQFQEAGFMGPSVDGWLRQLYASAVRWGLVRSLLKEIGQVLSEAGTIWIPLKGGDLGTRVYNYPEERPLGDLDILIPECNYAKARTALEKNGWSGSHAGRRFDRFILEEGHNWPARNSANILLELHIRLWGFVPVGLEAELVRKACPDPGLGPGGHRIPLSYAFIIAAVRSWLNKASHPLIGWRDLVCISKASDASLCEEVIELAQNWDIQLPIALAAANASSLWHDRKCQKIADALFNDLRTPERLAAWWALRRGADALPIGLHSLARLLSFRSSRGGWRVIYRRVWAHPGVVEQKTPEHWPWLSRRLFHVLLSLHAPVRHALYDNRNDEFQEDGEP